MNKDAFYFPHDSNAKDDPKCVLLIEQLGLEGYGIYWIFIETLRDQPGYTYPIKLIPALARRYGSTLEKFKAVATAFNLFQSDDEYFWSESLIRRMMPFEKQKENARKAGLASANKRLNIGSTPVHQMLNIGSTPVHQMLNSGSTSVQQREEKREDKSKVYESKVDEIGLSATTNLIQIYENNVGMVTPVIAERIKLCLGEYSFDWVKSAIEKSVTNEKRSWGYVEGILKGWKRDGFNPNGGNGNGHKTTTEIPKSKYKYYN